MGTSLYERLGGAPGIARIVDDVVAGHLANPVVQARFKNVKDMDHLKKMVHEFFCMGAGGPQAYTGKDLPTAHRGMNISEQEYLETMDDIMQALDKNGIAQDAKNEVVAILYSLKGDVIRV